MNELVRVDPRSNVEAYRASTEAAALCKEIVVATSSQIQGRRYVSVEGWQAIARAHGCAAGACEVARVEGGVRATGEVRNILTGSLIAKAEGFVGEDEAVWYGGTVTNKWGTKTHEKRADYAIRAMAQTRAMSRACRSAFAHVVIMMNAGLATTPAEEVPNEGFDRETGEIMEGVPVPEKVLGISKIKERLNAFMREGNACTDLEAFRTLKRANKDDIKTIRDAGHSYWTGDGDDWEGFGAWMERRQADLAPVEESLSYQLLMSTLAEVETVVELQAWLGKNGDVVESLDGEESRRFTAAYEAKETVLYAPRE